MPVKVFNANRERWVGDGNDEHEYLIKRVLDLINHIKSVNKHNGVSTHFLHSNILQPEQRIRWNLLPDGVHPDSKTKLTKIITYST